MNEYKIKWQQRFQNYLKAFALLEQAVEQYQSVGLSELEEQGLIQRFKVTHELACNVLKDYFEYQGNTGITGSRDATLEAFGKGLITDGERWIEMIISRNKSSHAYLEDTAKEIVKNITTRYFDLFAAFKAKMTALASK